MNSRQRSLLQPIRKPCFWSHVGSFCLALSLVACGTSPQKSTAPAPPETLPQQQAAAPVVELPEEITHEKAELLPLLQMMDKPGQEPARIRDKFDEYVSQLRERFTDGIRAERAEFNVTQIKPREQFLRELNQERVDFHRNRPTPKQLQEFSRLQENKRSEYYLKEKEHREQFEAQMRQKQNEFIDYTSNQRTSFNERFKRYSDEYRGYLEIRESIRPKGRAIGGAPKAVPPVMPAENPYQLELESWAQIPVGPGTPLLAK